MKHTMFLLFYLFSAFTSLIYSQQQKFNYRRDVPRDSVFLPPGPFSTIHRSGNTVWTELNPKVPRVTYLSTYFCNKDTGWCVGDGGAIIKTTNGGESWSTKASNTVKPLLCVHSFDGRTVIATGYDGTILLSTDEGENWTQVQSNATSDLWSVQMTGRYTGWICGLNSALLKTTDGGLTWEHVSTGFQNNYWALKFIGSTGYITCSNGNILKTTDTGLTWNQKSINYTNKLYCLYMFDSSSFMAAGYGGIVARTIDGGETFTYNYAGDNINSITFANDSVGCIFYQNSSSYCRTTNAGTTWVWTACTNIGDYCGIFINDSIGYNCGEKIKINKSTDMGASWNRLIINDDFRDVATINERTTFIVSGNNLYKTTDYCKSFNIIENAPAGNRLYFLSDSTGFLGATTLYKTTDQGIHWNKCLITGLPDSINEIKDIYFLTDSLGWAVSFNGKIIKTTNAGNLWTTLFNTSYIPFNCIHFSDSLNGWAGTNNYFPYRTTDGGNTWNKYNRFIRASYIYFIDCNNGWVIDDGILYRTIDGGNNWCIVIDNPETNFYRIWQITRTHWILCGQNIYESLDGGNNWQDITSFVGSTFVTFHSSSPFFGIAVSTKGTILKYYDTTYTPVELLNFSVLNKNDDVEIMWSTASETNNLGFEIEAGYDNTNFRKIGFIKGNGTSSEINKYSFRIRNNSSFEHIRLKQINYDGTFSYSKILDIIRVITTDLCQNYPNPFNSTTTFNYSIQESEHVQLVIYDILGNKINTIIDEIQSPGKYKIIFNRNNLASGVYFYKITTKNYSKTNKMILLK